MTPEDIAAIQALSPGKVSYLPGSWDKKFIRGMSEKPETYEVSVLQRAQLLRLLMKYRRQIPRHEKLHADLLGVQFLAEQREKQATTDCQFLADLNWLKLTLEGIEAYHLPDSSFYWKPIEGEAGPHPHLVDAIECLRFNIKKCRQFLSEDDRCINARLKNQGAAVLGGQQPGPGPYDAVLGGQNVR